MIFIAVTSYRGERFQVPTRLTTVTRQTGEYKVDLTRHPKLASGHFPPCLYIKWALFLKKQNRMKQDFRRELQELFQIMLKDGYHMIFYLNLVQSMIFVI
jgi:hypothetical protein